MIDANKLWKQRFQLYVKDTRRYLKLIFNDHFKFVLLFAVGGGAYYYQNWLKTLPEDFPAALIIALIIGIILTQSPIQTFLKEADLVFLLPVETELKHYFQRSILYSYMLQCYVLIFFIAALGPLYFQQRGTTVRDLLILAVILLIAKAVNIMTRWYVQYLTDKGSLRIDQFVRLIFNIVFVYFLVQGVIWIYPLVIGILLLLLFIYFYQASKGKGIKWEQLIEMEAERMMAFYRIANMFTDVPKFKEQVKRRGWLNWMTSMLRFEPRSTFSFLYLRTFSRTSDYLGIYARLLVIGGVLLYFLPLGYSKLLVLLLFVYLSGFQLLPLYRHHVMKIWVDLYPISAEVRRSNFLQLLFYLLLVKSSLLSIIIFLTGDIILAFLAIGTGFVFSYLFTFAYVKKKLVKQDEAQILS
ncbi:ABC transporter permease [Schinkia azotoformans]|uniref:ABC transporter permease n=1 Tax=Schinkia azotoformans TaxID=1454 RepID=UPI002DBFE96B|nr:ABC transporter permease [Schinkia azotoformans]MEC1722888.1 ABC transporter permease [Schinkia azotoformans]MED4354759.1 ABC transporter permease [Schinkia azotoformans]MED4415812.1 ABC transporter permease [Schinkia azotoformans]